MMLNKVLILSLACSIFSAGSAFSSQFSTEFDSDMSPQVSIYMPRPLTRIVIVTNRQDLKTDYTSSNQDMIQTLKYKRSYADVIWEETSVNTSSNRQ
jgi:hypothetical protein